MSNLQRATNDVNLAIQLSIPMKAHEGIQGWKEM